ncbi:DUF6305 family protein [candidate division KSB1 bacterium]
MKHQYRLICITVFIVLLYSISLFAQEADVPKAALPVLTTSAGQSTDINTINVILNQAKINYDYCDVPTVDMMKEGAGLGGAESKEGFHVKIKTDFEKFKKGTPYKTIVFAIGASLKGMGASGLTINDEINRLQEVIKYCKENNIFIIGIHAGGDPTRGAPGSDNEKMIDIIAPVSDYLIVVEASNKDGRFTKIAKDKNIPLSEVKYALGIVALMKKVFE